LTELPLGDKPHIAAVCVHDEDDVVLGGTERPREDDPLAVGRPVRLVARDQPGVPGAPASARESRRVPSAPGHLGRGMVAAGGRRRTWLEAVSLKIAGGRTWIRTTDLFLISASTRNEPGISANRTT
jgi:hypothetical protein